MLVLNGIEVLEVLEESRSTEVEPSARARYSSPLQFSTLVELQPGKVVGEEPRISYFLLTDFKECNK